MRAAQRLASRILRISKIKPLPHPKTAALFSSRSARAVTSVLTPHLNHINKTAIGLASLSFWTNPFSDRKKKFGEAESLMQSGKLEEALKILYSLPNDDEVAELRDKYISKDYVKAYKVLVPLCEEDTNITVAGDLMYVCHRLGHQYMCVALQMAELIVGLLGDERSILAERMWNNVGAIYYEMGFAEKAVECFSKSLDMNPGEQQYKKNYVNTMVRQNKLKEAEPNLLDLTKDLQMDNSAQTLLLIYFHQNRIEEARKLALKLSTKFPQSALAWKYLAISYLSSDVELAIQSFQKVLSLDSNNAHANDGMASCFTTKS